MDDLCTGHHGNSLLAADADPDDDGGGICFEK